MKNFLFSVKSYSTDFGIFFIRVSFSIILILQHGYPKYENFAAFSQRFFDPWGIGPATALGLSAFAEIICAGLVAIGFMTRLATIPLIINFAVAFFGFHYFDPFAKKELVFLFLLTYFALFIFGPGRISIDAAINRKKSAK